jgi:hypothetical protein
MIGSTALMYSGIIIHGNLRIFCSDASRIISEFIKISDKMLVLEKILKTTRFIV